MLAANPVLAALLSFQHLSIIAGLLGSVLPRGAGEIPVVSQITARVAELVDALDLGSSTARCESSSLSFRTMI